MLRMGLNLTDKKCFGRSKCFHVNALVDLMQISIGHKTPNVLDMQNPSKQCIKSNSHAPNLHTCIIYIRVNLLPVCIFAHANTNTHGS